MLDSFKIYIDRLRQGKKESFAFTATPDFIDVAELRFVRDIAIKGEAYITDDYLIIQLNAETEVELACSICNETMPFSIKLNNFYHPVPLDEIRGAIFDYSQPLRESIVLEIPSFIECEGNCPERAVIAPYLSPESGITSQEELPFKGLEI